jgi:CheY-like chemotaxis protein
MERELLQSFLQQGGYVVDCAVDGIEALEKIKHDPFHILLTDWEMPGMNGADLCRRVREAELPGYVYILLLTGTVPRSTWSTHWLREQTISFASQSIRRSSLRM